MTTKQWVRAWLAVGLTMVAAGGAAADYVVLTSGAPSGEMLVTPAAGGRRVVYRYNDRGRGPDLRSSIAIDDKGLPTRLTVEGVNYLKLAVDEQFERRGMSASWRSSNDSGAADIAGFYLPRHSTPEHLAILARALLKAPGNELPLLPAGRARLAPLADRELAIDGRPVTARLYAVSGLGFGPEPIWLDADGELIMEGGDWYTTVRKEIEPQARTLLVAQREALAAAGRQRTPALMRRPSGPVAITHVSIFDARARAMRRDMTVVVDGRRIASVTPAASAAIPADAMVIDGRGKTLLPGLWDMHTHVAGDWYGPLYLAAGVTSVRDLANQAAELAERRRLYDEFGLIGPRIVPAGFIDGPGPLAGPIKVLAATPEEMRTAIGNYAVQGYKAIKLYSSLDPKLVPVAVAEAHRLGMRVSGHVPARMTMRDVVEAGFDEVHHLNFVALNFMGPEINAKTNGITRITAVAEHAWEIDPASKAVADLVTLLKAKGTVVDPTMVLYEQNLLGGTGTVNPVLRPIADRLPPVVQRDLKGGGLAASEAEAVRNARSYKTMQGLLKALHDGGVPLVAGTDSMPGFAYHRELELYAEAGIPRLDVLYIATLGAARVAQRDAELGSIDPGKLADLVLVDGAPDERMADIRKTALVMKDGVLLDPVTLHAEVGVEPAER